MVSTCRLSVNVYNLVTGFSPITWLGWTQVTNRHFFFHFYFTCTAGKPSFFGGILKLHHSYFLRLAALLRSDIWMDNFVIARLIHTLKFSSRPTGYLFKEYHRDVVTGVYQVARCGLPLPCTYEPLLCEYVHQSGHKPVSVPWVNSVKPITMRVSMQVIKLDYSANRLWDFNHPRIQDE